MRRHHTLRDDERGATAVIVVLSLIALFGLIVLTVDVGQLLFQRRGMVNASDAAALAAAQSCAGLDDTEVPEAMADAFALNNVGNAITALPNITEMVGCDSEAYGHVSVEYAMNQNLFFAGVLGFNGPASVRTAATAGWGPTGGANPLPIVVYTGNDQGSCDIQADTPPDVDCYLWFDNDLFNGSSFGFLNLCTETDPCTHGWDVNASDSCPNVGASLRDDWINGNWTGGPNVVNYPDATYVCRVSGLSSSDWSARATDRGRSDLPRERLRDAGRQQREHGDLLPEPAARQVQHHRLHGAAPRRGPGPEVGVGGRFRDVRLRTREHDPDDRRLRSRYPARQRRLPELRRARPPTLSAPGNNPFRCCTLDTHYTFDPTTNVVDWIGNARDNVTIEWGWSEGGPCGVPPNNSSGVCLKVHTVEPRFGGTDPGGEPTSVCGPSGSAICRSGAAPNRIERENTEAGKESGR